MTVTLWDETVVCNTLGQDMPNTATLRPHRRWSSCTATPASTSICTATSRDWRSTAAWAIRATAADTATTASTHRSNRRRCTAISTSSTSRRSTPVQKLDRPGAFIFNCWVEAWGRHIWFWPEKNDPNVAALAVMDGKPAEGIFRMNSQYPKDGFWWDSQLRITPAFPGGVHFLEPYAQAVADLDACRITRGGLFLDKAHTEAIQQFARAYRALPRQKFATVGPSTDPVAVRTLVHDGRRYFYAVNRDYYPVKVDVAFSAAPKQAEDLATGEKMDLPQQWSLVLGPYELRSFAVAPEVEITGFTATPPENIVRRVAGRRPNRRWRRSARFGRRASPFPAWTRWNGGFAPPWPTGSWLGFAGR